MMSRRHWRGAAVPAVRVLAALVMMITMLAGTITSTAAQGSVDVAIYTVENGQSAYDACYVIVGYSEVGCDENRDGKVTFADIPYGSYTVQQTANLGSGRSVPDFTITVTGNVNAEGYEGFTATIVGGSGSSAGSAPSGYSNVAIVPTENGQPVYDACFVIVDYSQVGCDDNRDGKVTFEDIPLGTWTVRQVADLGAGRSISDFTIRVTGAASGDGWERFPATVGGTGGTSAAGAKDISLITRDPDDGHLLTGTCYILLDYSNEGCDENGDGQVTFDDMPPGTYTVRQTRTPAGYPAINDFPITIDDRYPNVPVGYLVRQDPQQSAPGTRNVSVVFIDSNTSTKIVPASVCLQFQGVSIVGCDQDLIDGQIDYLDLAIGTHAMSFSSVPSGWQVLADPSATITAGTGPQIIYIGVNTGGIGSSGTDSSSASDDAGTDSPELAEVVGEEGFTLAIDGVTVSGAPGVAPVGTTVQARMIEPDFPDTVSGFADPVGTGVEITLGGGLQPASPLTITFAPDEVSEWYSAADVDSDFLPVVFASRADGFGVELADAQLLPDGSVVVTADHLSWLQPSLASISGFADWLGDQIDIGLQMGSDRPDCVDQQPEDQEWEFSAVPDQLIWPCVTGAGEDLEVTFQNNSSLVWYVQSDLATAPIPTSPSLTGMAIIGVANQGITQRGMAPLVPPDGQVEFLADGSNDQIVFNVSLNEPLTIANSIITGASIVLPNKKVEAIMDAVGRADCFLDAIAIAPTAQEKLDEGRFGSFGGTILRCVGNVMEGLGGRLISAAASLPGAVRTVGVTADLNVRGYDEFSVTLSKIEDVPDEPTGGASSGTAWPSDRNEGPPSLFVWLGASTAWLDGNTYGIPDWVACDDARAYCLVGYPGEKHLLVQIRGHVVIGTVEDAAPDPRHALLALGLPDEIVTQILGQ